MIFFLLSGPAIYHTGGVFFLILTCSNSTLTCYAIKQNRDLDRPADVANPGGREQLRQQIKGGDIVSLPGVIQIPKCGQKEIAQNWRE